MLSFHHKHIVNVIPLQGADRQAINSDYKYVYRGDGLIMVFVIVRHSRRPKFMLTDTC